MSQFNIGDHVTAFYKTGKYIGEITNVRPEHYLVRVLAVSKHPMQGDLHSPKDTDVLFFHERKALSYREQMNVPKHMVKPFEGSIPEYIDSLNKAVQTLKEEFQGDDSPFAKHSLKNIESLEKDYFK